MSADLALNNVAAPAADNVAVVEKKKKLSLKKNVNPADFGGPSRPPSSFMLYSDEVRDEATTYVKANLKADEKFAISMVARRVGEMWKEVSDEKKAEYTTKAQELKAKHDAEQEIWKTTKQYKAYINATALHNKKKANKKAADTAKAGGMPAKPMTGYFLFGNEVRDAVRAELEKKGEKYSVKTAAPIQKAKWDALGEEGQKKYHDLFAAAKEQYAKDLAAWEETDAGKEYLKAKKNAEAAQKRKQQEGKQPRAKRAKKEDGSVEESVEDEDEEEDIELSPEEVVDVAAL
jgi:upstream-binding transcription factor